MPNGKVTNLVFGGKNFDTLYAMCGEQVFKRKVKTRGANARAASTKPAPPRL